MGGRGVPAGSPGSPADGQPRPAAAGDDLLCGGLRDRGGGQPLGVLGHHPDKFGEEFCRLRSFLSEAASYANVLTIVSFSLERYLAICRPLYVFPLSDLRRAVIVSSLCWAIAMCASVPHLLYTKINFIPFPYPDGPPAPESAFCAMLDIPEWYPVHEISFFVFFLLPVILLAFLY